ncbi:hypothetical protein [Nonomuraea rubra]|uniref:hypothetical protein n=1 Tax=Nonomuraea rubra TaxID=46180 RepID=UPI0033EAA5F1
MAAVAGPGSWVFLAGYLAILTLITVATTFVTPDPAGRDLDDPRDALAVLR